MEITSWLVCDISMWINNSLFSSIFLKYNYAFHVANSGKQWGVFLYARLNLTKFEMQLFKM